MTQPPAGPAGREVLLSFSLPSQAKQRQAFAAHARAVRSRQPPTQPAASAAIQQPPGKQAATRCLTTPHTHSSPVPAAEPAALPQVVEIAPRLQLLPALLAERPYGLADEDCSQPQDSSGAGAAEAMEVDGGSGPAGPCGRMYTFDELLGRVQVGAGRPCTPAAAAAGRMLCWKHVLRASSSTSGNGALLTSSCQGLASSRVTTVCTAVPLASQYGHAALHCTCAAITHAIPDSTQPTAPCSLSHMLLLPLRPALRSCVLR